MTKNFKMGDVVQLKSGGPKMTVTEVIEPDCTKVRTRWFAGSKPASGVYAIETLNLVEANDKH